MGKEIDVEDGNTSTNVEAHDRPETTTTDIEKVAYPYPAAQSMAGADDPSPVAEATFQLSPSLYSGADDGNKGPAACGLYHLHCHALALGAFFVLYITITCVIMTAVYSSVMVSWVSRQKECLSVRPVQQTCVLDSYVSLNYNNTFWWNAHTADNNVSVLLWPDCRFIVKKNYAGQPAQLFGQTLMVGQVVNCTLPADYQTVNVSAGVLTTTIWTSNTGKVGVIVSVVLGVVTFICFITCFVICCKTVSGFKDDFWAQREDKPLLSDVWCWPQSVFCSINPWHCLIRCIPLTFLWKICLNICIVILVSVIVIIYLLPTRTNSYNYY